MDRPVEPASHEPTPPASRRRGQSRTIFHEVKLSVVDLRRWNVPTLAKSWPQGTLLDCPGIRIGHHTRESSTWRTGTTVVLLPPGAIGGVDVRGGAPGTRETELLRPDNMMDRIDAICLSGGSAYGLSAADGVMRFLESKSIGFPVGRQDGWVVPIVPAAVIFDLGRGGRFDHRPDAEFGWRAARAAKDRSFRQGSVGGGTGARAGGLRGGIGSASRVVRGTTVAALAVVNSVGSVIDPDSALPWFTDGLQLHVPTAKDRDRFRRHYEDVSRPLISSAKSLNTTIGLVATDGILTKAECQKLAAVSHDGLARAIRPAHSMNDGDTIFGVSLGRRPLNDRPIGSSASLLDDESRTSLFNDVLEAAADVFARACTLAVLRASGLPSLPGYRDLVPSALRGYPLN